MYTIQYTVLTHTQALEYQEKQSPERGVTFTLPGKASTSAYSMPGYPSLLTQVSAYLFAPVINITNIIFIYQEKHTHHREELTATRTGKIGISACSMHGTTLYSLVLTTWSSPESTHQNEPPAA